MKQAQNAQKRRARPMSRNNGKSHNGSNRNEPKVRGNPKQLAEKYKNQAREALQAGDRMQAEYYFQFSDHYHRVANEMHGPGQHNNNQSDDDPSDDGSENSGQHGRRRNNNRRNNRGRDGGGENTQDTGNRSPDQQQGEPNPNADNAAGDDTNNTPNGDDRQPNPPRRRRPAKHVNVGEMQAAPTVDPSAQQQPAEVHPALNLSEDIAEKPVRRRAPARRKRAEGDSAVEAAVKPTTDGEAA